MVASFAVVAAPTPAVADPCGTCPAGGDRDDCADGCPLCVCGPHRAPMTAPPAVPSLAIFAAAEFVSAGDTAALTPIVRDILHVPRLHPALPQS